MEIFGENKGYFLWRRKGMEEENILRGKMTKAEQKQDKSRTIAEQKQNKSEKAEKK